MFLPVFVFQYMGMEQMAIFLAFLFYGVIGKSWARDNYNTIRGRWAFQLVWP